MISIGRRKIGPGRPCFIIAEAGVNHNGRLALALKLIEAAVKSGADAVKFQTFNAELLCQRSAKKAQYQAKLTDGRETQYQMLKRLELGRAAHFKLRARCQKLGILFLSTPFEEESADFLESMGMPAFKVPSGELTNLPFITHIARKRKPMIISTGMATLAEVTAAVAAARCAGNTALALLHAVSNYPASAASINLRAMETLRKRFGLPVGYSDHTMGLEISFAAAGLGACIIEKHFTLKRDMPGPDHAASLEPGELAALVSGIRNVERALGDGVKRPAAEERDTANAVRKSLVAAKMIEAGTRVTAALLASIRPGTGLPPSAQGRILGRKARRWIDKGTMLRLEMFS